MTEFYDYGRSPLSPNQQSREQALKTAASVLSASTNLFGSKSPVPAERGIDDLLKVADWVLGPDDDEASADEVAEFMRRAGFTEVKGGVIELTRDQIPSVFEALAKTTPDCGHEDCPIHAPAREAKDLNPEDAESDGWTDVGTTDGFRTPVDFSNTEQTGTAEASDFEGGESDNADGEGRVEAEPPVDPAAVEAGTVFTHNNRRWESRRRIVGNPGAYWYNLGDDEDTPEF